MGRTLALLAVVMLLACPLPGCESGREAPERAGFGEWTWLLPALLALLARSG